MVQIEVVQVDAPLSPGRYQQVQGEADLCAEVVRTSALLWPEGIRGAQQEAELHTDWALAPYLPAK